MDHFVANSRFIAKRIRKVYRRESTVIHPPVEVDLFPFQADKDEYYITASRLVPYKRIDLVVEAFARMPQRRLLVVGDGPELANCRKLARPNIEFLGYQEDEVLRALIGKARAFVFAAEEDFGIIVVEAQACGTPVICYKRGGVLDSVIEDQTGVFFEAQSAASIVDAVERFESRATALDPFRIRVHAEQFSSHHFRLRFMRLVNRLREEQQPDRTKSRWREVRLELKRGAQHEASLCARP